MKFLELKIPPVLLVLIFALLMFLISQVTENIGLGFALRLSGLLTLGTTSAFIAIAGVLRFKKAQTTVNPKRPESTSSLVQDGIYKFTRNPMYLGFSLLLFGIGLFVDNFYSILLAIGLGYGAKRQRMREKTVLRPIPTMRLVARIQQVGCLHQV